MEEEDDTLLRRNGSDVEVSLFDYSVDNHLKAMDAISHLCKEAGTDSLDETEIQRFSSSVTFLKEWKHYTYEPRTVRFSCGTEAPLKNAVTRDISLPQFSSAAVPKKEGPSGDPMLLKSSTDFVMHVGGLVWALDWCPRLHEDPDCPFKCEFVAVGAHPPGSYYHNIGAPLTGRGVVQIWCVLNVNGDEEAAKSRCDKSLSKPVGRPKKQTVNSNNNEAKKEISRPKGRPRKNQTEDSGNNEVTKISRPRGRPKTKQTVDSQNNEATKEISRPRGRPKKKPVEEPLDNLDCNDQHVQALAVQYPEDSSELLAIEGVSLNTQVVDIPENKSRKLKQSTKADPPVILPMNTQVVDIPENKAGKRKKSTKADPPVILPMNTQVVDIPENKSRKLKQSTKADPPVILPMNTQVVDIPENKAGKRKKSTKADPPVILPMNTQVVDIPENKARKQKKSTKADPPVILPMKIPVRRRSKNMAKARINYDNAVCLPLWNQSEHEVYSSMSHLVPENSGQGPPPLLPQSEHEFSSSLSHQEHDENSGQGPLPNRMSDNVPSGINFAPTSIPKGITLPRVMLCLAHNGKVAWDVKWRPCDVSISKCQHRMGYLAVLLGNGSLEVWDVPLPHTIKSIYCSSRVEGTDPRFVKLEPVFKCSIIKFGGQQSIPLTVEWSTSHPYDCLLAGCHDGTVALWKFSANGMCGETRPFLRFIADTFPIRAVAWAPLGSDHESGNVILTAGHLGVKFWDTRDPFRPLWNLQPNPRYVYSVDWLANPRCILLSFDDGTMRLLSLSKAAYDAPVHGKTSVGPKGIHMINGSSYATWSVQVSRLTGMVAYCSADGTVCHFQLTEKMVEKDPARNRTPHFMCCFLSEDETTVVVNTPLPNVPLTSQKSVPNAGHIVKSTQRTDGAGTKDPTSNDQVLALCYGNDPGPESESEETLADFRTKSKLKPKRSTKKMEAGSQALVPRDEEQEDMQRNASGKRGVGGEKKAGEDGGCERTSANVRVKGVDGNEIERIASKIIAMHRVRWNMNKGSERWLCYGGTAGIVRCQEINSQIMKGKGSSVRK